MSKHSSGNTRPQERVGTPGGRSPSERDSSPRLVALGVVWLLLMAPPAAAQRSHRAKSKARSDEFVTIINSGSTNTNGYTVTLYQEINSPKSIWVQIPDSEGGVKTDDAELVKLSKKLFHDIAVPLPLSGLSPRHGMRSASFGTKTYILYKGQRSPDLTFGGDARVNALRADVAAITQALHIRNTPRHPIVPHLNSTNTP